MTNPVDYEAVRQLYDEGMGRNAIAQELGITHHAVDKACRAMGISWGDRAPRLAVQVRSRRAAEERARLAEKLRAVALAALEECETPGISARDMQAAMTTAGIAIQRELDISTHVAERGEHTARSIEEIRRAAQERELIDMDFFSGII